MALLVISSQVQYTSKLITAHVGGHSEFVEYSCNIIYFAKAATEFGYIFGLK